jgi:hypothetical protein
MLKWGLMPIPKGDSGSYIEDLHIFIGAWVVREQVEIIPTVLAVHTKRK